MTGGEELTVTSTAAASTMANVRFEVIGYTSLVLDVPDLTMTGIYQSVSGGSGTHVFIFLSFFGRLLQPSGVRALTVALGEVAEAAHLLRPGLPDQLLRTTTKTLSFVSHAVPASRSS